MKTKFYVLAALLMANLTNLRADGTIIHPYSGSGTEDKAVNGYSSTSTHLFINRSKFAEAVPGNEIHINGWNVQSGAKFYIGKYIEGEGSATPLPGSDFRTLDSLPVSIYLTEDMIAAIGNEDFRIYGENMTLNCVTLFPGKAGALKFGKTIWTGSFEMVDKRSLEIFKEAFTVISNEEFAKYGIMRIYYDANHNDFLMRLFTKFGTPGVDDFTDSTSIKIAGSQSDEHMGEHATGVTPKKIYLHDTYVDVPLTDTIKTYLKTNNDEKGRSLFIKCNLNNEVAPFNVTDVVLLPISPDGCDNCFYVY